MSREYVYQTNLAWYSGPPEYLRAPQSSCGHPRVRTRYLIDYWAASWYAR